jgi:MFS family permease
MLFEVATIIANSVFGALINDVVPQPLLGRFFGLFRALSLIAAIIFNFGVLGKAETAYVWICIGIGALYGIGFTLMCLKVKEGEYPDVVPMDAGKNVHGIWQTTRSYFQECFGKSYYRWVFFACAIAGLATGPVNLFSYFFAKSLGMSLENYAFCLGLTYCISLVLAYPTGWLADRIHPLRLAIGILALYGIVTFWGGLFATDARLMGIALVAHGIVAGGWATATASLSQRLLPKAEFAQFASAGGIVANISWMLLAPAAGFILDRLDHDYRHTYFMGFALAVAGLAGLVILHGKFMKLGGPENYVAPK